MSNKTIIGIGCLVLAWLLADHIVFLAGMLLVNGFFFAVWGMYEDGIFK